MAEITYTIKTKIFNERTVGDLQKAMNDWLNKNDVEILQSSTSAYPMFDFYKSKGLLECDRWMQYSAMIIYRENDKEARRKRYVKERFDMIKKGDKPAFCGIWITKEEYYEILPYITDEDYLNSIIKTRLKERIDNYGTK